MISKIKLLLLAITTLGYAITYSSAALPNIANLRLDRNTTRRASARRSNRRQSRALKMGLAAALSDLRSPVLRRQSQTRSRLTVPRTNKRQLAALDALPGATPPGSSSFMPNMMQPMGNLVNNVFSTLDSGWRGAGKQMNGDSIPAVKTVLDRLGQISGLVNGINSGLTEVDSVFGELGALEQSARKPPSGPTQMPPLVRTLASSGIFGISGAFRGASQQRGSQQPIFASLLPATFQSALFSRLPEAQATQWMEAPVEDKLQQLDALSMNQANVPLAQQDLRQLGAQIAGLTTLFSGGHQIPCVTSFSHVEQSFSPLNLSPGDVELWTNFVMSLQQYREDLTRMPMVFSLTPAQTTSINACSAVCDNTLSRIGGHTGLIDYKFLTEISDSLKSAATSMLALHGSTLTPRLNFLGVDVTQLLPQELLSLGDCAVPVNLDSQEFLRNGFNVLPHLSGWQPVPLSGDGIKHLMPAMPNPNCLSDLLTNTLNSFPPMLTSAVNVGETLSSIHDGLLSSINLANGPNASLLADAAKMFGVDQLFQRLGTHGQQMGNTRLSPDNLMLQPLSPEGVLPIFAKLLLLENAMSCTQSLIGNLSPFFPFQGHGLPPMPGPLDILGQTGFPPIGLPPVPGSHGQALAGGGPIIPGGHGQMPIPDFGQMGTAGLQNLCALLTNLPPMMPPMIPPMIPPAGNCGGMGMGSRLSQCLSNNQAFVGRRLQEAKLLGKGDCSQSKAAPKSLCSNLDNLGGPLGAEVGSEALALNAFSGCISEVLSTIEDSANAELDRVCVTPDELATVNAIRAAALVGDAAKLMKASKTDESTINNVLGHSDSSSALEPDSVSSSSFCEKKREAVAAVKEWSQSTKDLFAKIHADSLIDTPDAVKAVTAGVALLASKL